VHNRQPANLRFFLFLTDFILRLLLFLLHGFDIALIDNGFEHIFQFFFRTSKSRFLLTKLWSGHVLNIIQVCIRVEIVEVEFVTHIGSYEDFLAELIEFFELCGCLYFEVIIGLLLLIL
jgi:hypothetical protein